MTGDKPIIFFGSPRESSRDLDWLAIHVCGGSDSWAAPRPWTIETFEPGMPQLESFLERTGDVDFAVLLFWPTDKIQSRGRLHEVPRDNLLVELGVFLAKLGPERVFVIASSESLKIPSDYAGHTIITIDGKADQPPEKRLGQAALQVRNHARKIWEGGLREATLAPTAEDAKVVYPFKNEGFLVPIYRDLEYASYWFTDFRNSVEHALPSLDSRMLYYGPGLAQNWFRLCSDDETEQRSVAQLERACNEVLHGFRRDNLNVVDLGIGNFHKGSRVLQRQFDEGTKTINFFAVDISYEMLLLSLRPDEQMTRRARMLRAVAKRGGKAIGINAPFDKLARYSHLFMPPSANLFLLLGNTLGNELSEIQTLAAVAGCMGNDDRLLADVQLVEEELDSAEEICEREQDVRYYYGGPLLAVHCTWDDMALFVRRDDDESLARGIKAVTYKLGVTMKRSLRVTHPGFGASPVEIPRAEICTFIVRKYHEDQIDTIFNEAGLIVERAHVTEHESPRDRRWCYVLARRREPSVGVR